MMRVLVAFDKFKEALTANQACETACLEFRRNSRDCEVHAAPLTDGGEGFCEILTTAAEGEFHKVKATDARGRRKEVNLGIVQAEKLAIRARELGAFPEAGSIAVIEMASVAGLHLLGSDDRDPWETSTHGVGEMISAAIELAVDGILLGIGGSATNDLGFGALQVLGLRFLDNEAQPIERFRPAVWHRLQDIKGKVSVPPLLKIACDVDNPLLGPSGATAVYGPQKGFSPQEVERVEARLPALISSLMNATGASPDLVTEAGAGAAGGLGFGLRAAAEGSFVPGFELVSAWLGLDERMAQADLVVTGEGRFDSSSLRGKGPWAVAKRADELGKRTLILAGSIDPVAVDEVKKSHPKVELHAISREELTLEKNIRRTAENLAKVLHRLIENGN